jgi:hypothetical protein
MVADRPALAPRPEPAQPELLRHVSNDCAILPASSQCSRRRFSCCKL